MPASTERCEDRGRRAPRPSPPARCVRARRRPRLGGMRRPRSRTPRSAHRSGRATRASSAARFPTAAASWSFAWSAFAVARRSAAGAPPRRWRTSSRATSLARSENLRCGSRRGPRRRCRRGTARRHASRRPREPTRCRRRRRAPTARCLRVPPGVVPDGAASGFLGPGSAARGAVLPARSPGPVAVSGSASTAGSLAASGSTAGCRLSFGLRLSLGFGAQAVSRAPGVGRRAPVSVSGSGSASAPTCDGSSSGTASTARARSGRRSARPGRSRAWSRWADSGVDSAAAVTGCTSSRLSPPVGDGRPPA